MRKQSIRAMLLGLAPFVPFARMDESGLSGDALGSLKSETNQRLGLAGDNICNLRTKSESLPKQSCGLGA